MRKRMSSSVDFFFFQAEDGIRDLTVTGVQTCALPICLLAVATLFILAFVHRTIYLPSPARFTLALLLVAVYGIPMGFPLALLVRELEIGRASCRERV